MKVCKQVLLPVPGNVVTVCGTMDFFQPSSVFIMSRGCLHMYLLFLCMYEGYLLSPETYPFILLLVIFMYISTNSLSLNKNRNRLYINKNADFSLQVRRVLLL